MAATPLTGQLNPSATTVTKLFTADGNSWAHVVAANRSVTDTTIRISKRIAGAGADDKQFIAYDLPLPGNDVYATPKIALADTDEVWVYTADATVSFSLEGIKIA